MVQHKPRLTRLQSRTSAAALSEFPEFFEDMNGNGEEWVEGEENEEGWEDEDEVSQTPPPRTTSPAGSAFGRGARMRRRPPFTKRKSSTLSSGFTAKPSQPGSNPSITWEDVFNWIFHGTSFIVKYTFDVFGRALHYLRYPLSIFLFLLLLVYITGKMHRTLRSAVAPLCFIPGISRHSLCRPEPVNPRVDYPRLVEAESRTFEQLLDDFVTGSALSLQVKHAEMATTDLVALVRISDLKAKNTLATSLLDFVDDAKKTGKGLQKLSSKVGGAVDRCALCNRSLYIC